MESSAAPTRVLVVASTTPRPLLDAVRARAQRGPCTFTLLHVATWGKAEARRLLDEGSPLLSEAAGSKVDGIIGDADPVAAVQEALNSRGFDEVIISTRDPRHSRWLRMDLPRKVAAMGIPVTTITAEDEAQAELPIAVRFDGISKRFGGTIALDDVTFDIQPASVHALLGGNGSGKSTLIKILTGIYQADSGWIEVSGQRHAAQRATPDWARTVHVHVVQQGIGTFPDLTVADNFALSTGHGTRSLAPIASRSLNREVRGILTRFELDVSPTARMRDLSPAMQTMIAVARALPAEDERGSVLILDEPTAALPQNEEQMVLDAVRGFKARGHTVILVTHRLDEVVAVADDVTFLRDGRYLGTREADDIDEGVMVRQIAGMDQSPVRRALRTTARMPRLDVRAVSVGPLSGVSFSVGVGEVVGLSGLLGSGRSSLMLSLFGVWPLRDGEFILDGKRLRVSGAADSVRQGIAYLSAERQREGVFSDRSVRENLSITNLRRYWRRLWLSRSSEARDARKVIRNYGVVVAGSEAPVSSMSGGNQQKVALARWLELKPRLLLLNEPTQGVDVGARAAIHQLVRDAAEAGMSVLVASSDSRELAELCDRVLGLYNGGISGEAAGDQLTPERCLELAIGGAPTTEDDGQSRQR